MHYTIASYGDDFYTGKLVTGQLVLIGLLCPSLILVYFDPQGNYQSYLRLELASPPKLNQYQIYDMYQPEFQASLKQEIKDLWKRIGFSKQPIDISPFDIAELPIGLTLLPEHLAEFLENPSVAEDDYEADSYRASIALWEQSGYFVLWWGKDYWFGANGEVEST